MPNFAITSKCCMLSVDFSDLSKCFNCCSLIFHLLKRDVRPTIRCGLPFIVESGHAGSVNSGPV